MISFGTVFLELVFGQVRRLPRPGQEVFTDEFAISCGGAVTSATAAAAAGVRAGLCTVLGDDVGSRLVIDHCAAAGVDLGPSLRVDRAAAGISVVLNFDGDRGFVTHVPPAAAGEPDQAGRWQEVLRRERPAWCYLHAGAGIAPVLRTARDLGCKIMLDTSLGDRQDVATTIECARLADVFVPNADELKTLTGTPDVHAAIAAGAAWGADLVVTRGTAGALVAPAGGPVAEVTAGVREVVARDLTGAGDAFAGALIAALIGGASLTQAAAAGNAAGSAAVTRLGAVGEVTGSSAIAGWPLGPAETAWLTGRPER
ncbi:MAG: carbohydrate kinase family protein [Streptosporangiaceae bacterium]